MRNVTVQGAGEKGGRLAGLLLAFLVTATAQTPVAAGVNTAQGHLNVKSLSPGHLLRPSASISVMPSSLQTDWTMRLGVDWGNVWNYRDPQFIYDAEQLFAAASITYRLNPRFCISASFPYSGRTGGSTDHLIENFHRALGLTNANRESQPRNKVLIRIQPDGETVVSVSGDSWGRNDIPLFGAYQLTEGGDWLPALALQMGMTMPVGDQSKLQGVGSPVYGGALLASKRLGASPHIVLTALSFSYSRQNELAGIDLRREEITALVGWEFEWSQKTSIIAQYLIGSPVAEHFYEFSDPIHELNVGFKRRFTDRCVLEWSFAENLFTFDNSTDVAMHLGMQLGF